MPETETPNATPATIREPAPELMAALRALAYLSLAPEQRRQVREALEAAKKTALARHQFDSQYFRWMPHDFDDGNRIDEAGTAVAMELSSVIGRRFDDEDLLVLLAELLTRLNDSPAARPLFETIVTFDGTKVPRPDAEKVLHHLGQLGCEGALEVLRDVLTMKLCEDGGICKIVDDGDKGRFEWKEPLPPLALAQFIVYVGQALGYEDEVQA